MNVTQQLAEITERGLKANAPEMQPSEAFDWFNPVQRKRRYGNPFTRAVSGMCAAPKQEACVP